jgi:SAM-dependent methyltransferase
MAALHVSELEPWLAAQPRLLGEDWLRTLDARKQEEAHFHDADRHGHRDEVPASSPNRRFYESAAVVQSYVAGWMQRTAPGARFLDYACGNGFQSVRAAKAGASLVVGIDISGTSIKNASETASAEGVGSVCWFLQRDCELTQLRANSFDAGLCSGMLHHLDLDRAFPELHRIMAPRGRLLCVEALAYNPVIRLYRSLTPSLRTEWESRHILGMKEVRLAKRWFEVANMRCFLMAAPLATFLPAGPVRRIGLRAGHAADALLTRVPILRLWSWQFVFELVKRERPPN